MGIVKRDSFLAGFITESGTKFNKEFLQVIQNSFLQFLFTIFKPLFQSKKFQKVGVADNIYVLNWFLVFEFTDDRLFVLG